MRMRDANGSGARAHAQAWSAGVAAWSRMGGCADGQMGMLGEDPCECGRCGGCGGTAGELGRTQMGAPFESSVALCESTGCA
ncbi:hypothetical protein B5F40_04700 [Gordonibacter sp. An230]|nr:hypothetical protein B5F40_04700 [Gordonibacter sp. An230]